MSPHHPVTDLQTWDSALASLPNAHLLQCWQWGEFKSRYGWSARRLLWTHNDQPVAAAQVLKRSVGPLSILYVPKGPCLDWSNADLAASALADLESLARRERAIFIKIDPEIDLNTEYSILKTQDPSRFTLHASRFTLSSSQVQFKNTVWLGLARPEEDIIASFKQKTRYNIRLAERKGVTVRIPPPAETPLDLLYHLYAETSVRDGFVIRHPDYYRDAWGGFIQAGRAQPFVAEVEGQPVAAIIVFHFAKRALYMYGMSSGEHREKMPNHLLQWAAIQWARAQGCTLYDFWGAPDVFEESDPMYGVWRFKEGFNGTVVRTPGALDYAPSPLLYRLYTVALPRLLDVMRRRGKAQTKAMID
ncbi:MAG TPA: peptidoglycan bridge formation glycyltransferase FemA/FemB family protein [Anaerolineales bacterium]|nr:peptidoglycan bridge formation glycyltransferase FemA/FemB family protein [Anaerolineales bacterium]